MSKFAEIDPQLLNDVTAAVAACWETGSPVAGHKQDRWQQIAHVAIRRIRSLARRDVSPDDRRAQIRDIAQGLVDAFEADASPVGPLFVDYEHVAEQALEAARGYESKQPLGRGDDSRGIP